MTLKQAASFVLAYVAVVALAIWFDLAVLCQGDPKYSGGCGGFALYIPLWVIFLTPLPIAAIVLELWQKSEPTPMVRLLSYLGGILFVAQIGFLVIQKFPLLLACEAAAIAIAAAMRWRTVRRARADAAAV